MDRSITKKKNDLMKSILGNPKLSKAFKEAMAAPIGSTKREQAKTVLSIMKKLGGVTNDGKGGPGAPMQMQPNPPLPSSSTAPDYSNMIIFPAAPKFKVSTPKTPALPDGQGGPYDSLFTNPYTPSQKTGKVTDSVPTGPIPGAKIFNAIFNPQKPERSLTGNATSTPLFGGAFSNPSNVPDPLGNASKMLGIPQVNWPTLTTRVKGQQTAASESAGQNQTMMPESAIKEILAKTNSTQTTETPVTQTGETTKTGETPGLPNVGSGPSSSGEAPSQDAPPMSEADRIKNAAQQSVNEGTGPGLFAKSVADEKFGGSLEQYIDNLDKKLKVDFNLDALETELSNLKASKNNLVPTLTQYITGKDKYLKFVDEMIDRTEGELLKTDIGNPAVANSYNNYLNYLYTLKGRQSQRYGNFLNSAISEYNADLERTQSNYENVYNQYNNAITRKSGIAQNEYNTLYTTMADLYTNLEQAPIKRANLEALQLQNQANALIIAQNALANGLNTNPKYLEDVKKYSEHITDKDGNLSIESLGAGGLAGFFSEIDYTGGDPQAAAKAITTAMANTLKAAGPEAPKKALEFKEMVNELSALEGGDQLAAMISPSLSKAAYPVVSSYILDNMKTVRSAVSQLVNGKGWFNKSAAGLKDPEGWMKNFSNSLDPGVLDSLYNTAVINMVPGSAYEKNPSTLASALLTGKDDQEVANNLTTILLSSW